VGEEPSNDEEVDVEMDEGCGGPAAERGVEEAGGEARTCGVVAEAVEDSQQ